MRSNLFVVRRSKLVYKVFQLKKSRVSFIIRYHLLLDRLVKLDHDTVHGMARYVECDELIFR